MKQNEIINGEDYMVKYKNGVITNGCFNGYPIFTKQNGKGLLYKITICDSKKPIEIITDKIANISHKEVAEELRKKVVLEVSTQIINAVNNSIKNGEDIPRKLQNLDYYAHIPTDLILDEEFTKQLADDISQTLVDAGKGHPQEVKDLVSRGYANFILNDLNQTIDDARQKTDETQNSDQKFAELMNDLSHFVK